MDFIKKPPALMYLDRNGFYFYQENLSNIISLAFLETSVKDMDVINSTSLFNQIKGFVEQYHLTPSTISIILSPNITFEKDFVGLNHELAHEEVDKFIETVPFESVLVKEYPIENGTKVITANDDLYKELKLGFEKVSFSLEDVIPFQMLGQDQGLIKNLTLENANQLLKKIDRFKQYSMALIVKDKIIIHNPGKKTDTSKKKNNTRLYAMIGIFIILFAILGVMLLRMR